MSLHFVSKQRKTFNAVVMPCLIFWLQARELRLSVCLNTFLNFLIGLSPAQTIEKLSMTFTADGKRQRLPVIFYSFLVIIK